MITIQANTRDRKDNSDELRKAKLVPAVVYGPKLTSTMISVPLVEFTKALKEAGESTTIELSVSGTKHDVLIHDVTFDPVKHVPMHVDFYAVDKDREIVVAVPLNFSGVSPAVKGSLGTLVKVMHELEIKALPKNLPHEILVDLSLLVDLDSNIKADDIALPNGVLLATRGDIIVASIAPLGSDEPVESAPIDLSKIEVAKKGKKEEEEA